jgi:hypothetical protein
MIWFTCVAYRSDEAYVLGLLWDFWVLFNDDDLLLPPTFLKQLIESWCKASRLSARGSVEAGEFHHCRWLNDLK